MALWSGGGANWDEWGASGQVAMTNERVEQRAFIIRGGAPPVRQASQLWGWEKWCIDRPDGPVIASLIIRGSPYQSMGQSLYNHMNQWNLHRLTCGILSVNSWLTGWTGGAVVVSRTVVIQPRKKPSKTFSVIYVRHLTGGATRWCWQVVLTGGALFQNTMWRCSGVPTRSPPWTQAPLPRPQVRLPYLYYLTT